MRLAFSHDELSSRPLVRLMNRFRHQEDIAQRLPASFAPLRDESSPRGARAKRFILQPSTSLLRVPFLQYRLVTSKPGLREILLGVMPDIPGTSGTIQVELVSLGNRTMATVVRSLREIDGTSPTLFAFSVLDTSTAGAFDLRVFVKDADSPVRLLEWRSHWPGGLGPAETRAFCACVYEA
jgi:hypothetical protein